MGRRNEGFGGVVLVEGLCLQIQVELLNFRAKVLWLLYRGQIQYTKSFW